MIGKTYYGIAASFYGNKLGICTAKKNGDKGQVVKVDKQLSFKESDPEKLQDAAERFIRTIIGVATMQAYENDKNNSEYPMPVILGWPGINQCQGMQWLNGEMDGVNYNDKSFKVYHDDNTIRNLGHCIELNLGEYSRTENIASSGIALSTAIFDPPKPIIHNDQYKNAFIQLKSLYEIMTNPSSTYAATALKKLKMWAIVRGTEIGKLDSSRFSPENIKRGNFVVLTDPIYQFLDHPELSAYSG